ncbi:hypothetical protein B0A52_09952 [Exophiala mesophila]|uniref:Protein MAM3 n=1 Tax=Exophiala mesophila TaxID=212818 RepID=A0A438MTE7_EXOME|nr:hypothetical protein B0A52_09952 [Exophiala mesophila]
MAKPATASYLAARPLVLGLAKILSLCITQLPLANAAPIYASTLFHPSDKEAEEDGPNQQLWLYLTVAAALVLLGGAFAGLTIALMGQDEIYLQVIRDSGEGAEKIHAAKVLRLLKQGKHWVLVTLLLSNVITNETLPIVLDRSLGGGWPAVLGSTVLIVIFGEIVPQSICVRFGLPIGAWMSPFVSTLMYIMAPVAWPTAKLLDYLLGEDHGTVYKKAGLKTLVSLHRSLGEVGQQLNADEVTIISAVLDLKDKPVGSIMTPMDDVFTLSLDDVLDEPTMDNILSQGYSRIPIHHPDNDNNFVGMLLVKMLITYDPEDAKPVRDFALATLPETRPSTSCLDIVNFFQEGKSHMVLVSEFPGDDHGALGVVTLEDVIEELIGEEIVDESDVFIDVHRAIRRAKPAPTRRISRNHIVTDPPSAQAPGADLIDINESDELLTEDLQRTTTTGDQQLVKHKVVSNLRRRSSAGNSIGSDIKGIKRPSTDEIKEHLKHLGPSNLASRPKTTRYSTVKIKPGAENSTTKSNIDGVATPARRVSETFSDYQGGIGQGLLKSGGKPASDGVQALQQGYGTLSASPDHQRPLHATKGIQADLLSPTNVRSRSEGASPPTQSNLKKTASQSTLGSLPEARPRSRSPYHSKGPARSGSITESIVDTNGFRKVVLETTSSSDSNEDEDNSGANRAHSNTENGKTSQGKDSNPQIEAHSGLEEATNSSSKKKKRRRKKRGANAYDETMPLL